MFWPDSSYAAVWASEMTAALDAEYGRGPALASLPATDISVAVAVLESGADEVCLIVCFAVLT